MPGFFFDIFDQTNPNNCMPTIRVFPDDISIDVKPKTTILKASKKAGSLHQHACGGRGKCSTCRVRILKGLENCKERTRRENKIATKLHFADDIRLACQTVVMGDITIQKLIVDEIDVEIARNAACNKNSVESGQEIEATLVFIDLYKFTTFTAQNQPYDVMHVLNRYYYIAGKAISKHHGKILDYYGDGILAIFGTKKGDNHAKNAIDSCRDFLNDFQRLTDYSFLITPHPFKCRIGIHSGKVIIGMMGMPGFEKLAVVGDEVNVTSRIENANKKFDTTLLISESTKQLLNGSVDIINTYEEKAKGIEKVMKLYEVNL